MTVTRSHHTGPRSARKVFSVGRACKLCVVNYRVGDHRKPQENFRQGQEQTQGRETVNGSVDERKDRNSQSSARWYGKKTKKRWNKCLESPSGVAGRGKGNCVMFALPPGMESTPSGKRSRTSEVRSVRNSSSKSKMAASARPSAPNWENCWDHRPGNLSPLPLQSPVGKTFSGPDTVWQQSICSPSL